jgi:2-methylcitrate dehydratase PrpD
LKGDNGVAAYAPEVVADVQVRALAQRIVLHEDPAYTAQAPAVRPARIEIVLTDGRKLAGQVDHPPGNFDNPFPDGVLDAKFKALAGTVLAAETVARLDHTVASLPTLPAVSELTRLLAA